MIEVIKHNINAIANVCKQHHVEKLYVFGSAARENDFTNESDIDILVNFENLPLNTNEDIFYVVENKENFEDKLREIIKRDIDLVEEKNIHNKYLRYFINKDKKLLYGIS